MVHGGGSGTAQPNAPLIRLLVRAHELQQHLLRGTGDLDALAQQADLGRTYTARLLRLSWLAPDVMQAILRGHQPPGLTADRLSRMARIPIDWYAQRVALGFR